MKVETAVILVLEIGSTERYACVVHVHVCHVCVHVATHTCGTCMYYM